MGNKSSTLAEPPPPPYEASPLMESETKDYSDEIACIIIASVVVYVLYYLLITSSKQHLSTSNDMIHQGSCGKAHADLITADRNTINIVENASAKLNGLLINSQVSTDDIASYNGYIPDGLD